MPVEAIEFGVVAAAIGSDPRQAARLSREMGFAGLQFDVSSGPLDLIGLSGSGRREFRRVLSSENQQLIGLRYDLGPKGLGPGADVDRALNQAGKAMEAAAGLSAPLLCIDIGPLPAAPVQSQPKSKVTQEQAGLILLPAPRTPAPEVRPDPASAPDPAFVAQVNAALVELGRLADRYSVVVAFRSELASFASLEQTLRQANCPWFGVDFDPVSVLQDEWGLDEIFSRLGALLRHVRARDAVRGADRRTRPAVVGQGSVDRNAILSNLEQADYKGWITIDPLELPDRRAGAAAGLARLRQIAAQHAR